MTTKEQQVKNTIIYVLPVLANNLIPLLTLSIFTRILTEADYGALALVQVYAVFTSSLANLGLQQSYERNFFLYKDSKEASALLYSTLVFIVTISTFFAFITYLSKESLSLWIVGTSKSADLLFYAFCSASIISFKQYYLVYFKNMEDAKKFTFYTISESLLIAAFSLYMVACVHTGVVGLVYGQILGSAIVFIVLSTRFLIKMPFYFSLSMLRESLKISYPLTPRIFFGTIRSQFDKYMVGLLGTLSNVGIYSIGQRISYSIFTYMTAIENVFVPTVYKKMFDMDKEGSEYIGRYLTPFCYISIAIAIMVAIFSEELIMLLTPKSYHNAMDIIVVLSVYYGILFFGKQRQLIFAKKGMVISLLSLFSVGLNICLNIPFILKWGGIGAAWATLLSALISESITFALAQHYYEIKWEYKKIAAIYLTFIMACACVILFKEIGIAYPFRLTVKLLFCSLYTYIGVKLKVITIANYRILKGFLPVRSTRLTPSA